MTLSGRVTLGQFILGDSYIHNLDPRAKIIGTVILLTGLFMASNPLDFIIWSVVLKGLSILSKTRLAIILRSARPVIFLVGVTVLLNILWTPGREILRIGFLRITEEGLLLALRMGLRLIFLVIFASLLLMTTNPLAFSDGLERLMSPLARLGFPASEMAMIMTIALRFIPNLFEETDRILKAQISRGADFDSGGLMKRAKSYIPVLVPLFVLIFARAENLATAMEARCYVPGAPRSRLNPLVWQSRDTLALCYLLAAVTGIVLLSRYLEAL